MAEHIHWKETTNSKYLGSWDLKDGKDMIVKIQDVVAGEHVTGPRGDSLEVVVYFENGIKPMIVGSTNKKNIAKALNTPYLDEWVGQKIQIFVEPSSKSETGMALRIRPFAPR